MLGIVLAIVKTSAWSACPSAAASRALRTKPLSRETTVPAAITALADRMLASAPVSGPGPGAAGWSVHALSS